MSETRERPVVHIRHMVTGAVVAYALGVLWIIALWSDLKAPPSFAVKWVLPVLFAPMGASIGHALADALKTWKFRW